MKKSGIFRRLVLPAALLAARLSPPLPPAVFSLEPEWGGEGENSTSLEFVKNKLNAKNINFEEHSFFEGKGEEGVSLVIDMGIDFPHGERHTRGGPFLAFALPLSSSRDLLEAAVVCVETLRDKGFAFRAAFADSALSPDDGEAVPIGFRDLAEDAEDPSAWVLCLLSERGAGGPGISCAWKAEGRKAPYRVVSALREAARQLNQPIAFLEDSPEAPLLGYFFGMDINAVAIAALPEALPRFLETLWSVPGLSASDPERNYLLLRLSGGRILFVRELTWVLGVLGLAAALFAGALVLLLKRRQRRRRK
ncbi:MAG: hypothetical protein LBR16_04040 [Treponema sp.]|jgi:hypothetical protein|nr:hypothetical protein [Treponema sp.]